MNNKPLTLKEEKLRSLMRQLIVSPHIDQEQREQIQTLMADIDNMPQVEIENHTQFLTWVINNMQK